MQVLDFIKNYWVLITFLGTFLSTFIMLLAITIESIKCSLRNDILSIYDRCKDDKTITQYQMQSIEHSYTLYKRLKGNSFVENIVERVEDFKLVD